MGLIQVTIMTKCNIKCKAIDHHRDIRRWEVTPDNKVWPCCFFSNAWAKREVYNDKGRIKEYDSIAFVEDEKLMNLMNNDPNWNNLEHHSLDEIIEHEIFQTYIYKEGWNSNSPPKVCVNNCCED